MTYANTTLLGLNQPTTGSESGVWGDDVNNGFTQLVDISVAGTNNITQDSDITLSVTNGNNSSTFSTTGSNSTVAQYAVLNLTGARTANRNIIVPASSKIYLIVNNATGGYSFTVKKSGGTGVTIAPSERAYVYYDSITATDVIKVSTYPIVSGVSQIIAGSNITISPSGGTGAVTINATGSSSAYTRTSFTATTGQTTFSVTYTVGYLEVYLNGAFLNGTDFTATNGTTMVLATGAANGDIVETIAYNSVALGSAANIANGAAGEVVYQSGSGATSFTAVGTTGQVLTSNGTSAPTWSTLSYPLLSSAQTWTATQTFNGSSSTFSAVMLNVAETVNVVGSAPSSTTNFYVQSGSVQYYTTNAANNWTLNIAFSSGTSLNTALSTGQSMTIAMLATQGSTAYYNSAVTIDGTSVTPYWQGGSAPSKGNASGIDVYTYTVIKTGSATYTVLASQTQF